MSGTVVGGRGGARAALSPIRMDSCIADPQQELLIVFKERNLRWLLRVLPEQPNQILCLFRVFVDILAEDSVDVNKQYPLENHQTILQVDSFFKGSYSE